jgi:uncharacterized protein
MKKALGLSIAMLLVCFGQTAVAQTFPDLVGHIADQADLLDAGTVERLARELELAEQQFSVHFVVVTVRSLEGKSVEDFAVDIQEEWGIGDAQHDDGLILLVAPNDRRVRLQVGYGLESAFPDAVCQDIIDDAILPHFRESRMKEGIAAGVHEVIARMKIMQLAPSNDNEPTIPSQEAA